MSIILLYSSKTQAQEKSMLKQFLNLHIPEQWWVICHPFIAVKTWKITKNVEQIAKEMEKSSELDSDGNGGQVDAFRHCLWMASLCQKIRWKKAYRLGVAHEKGNRIDYKRGNNEDGSLPDAISSEMDLRNNEVGIKIGKKYKKASREELIEIVKQAVLNGELWIIKKTEKGEFLDWDGNIIPKEEYIGKWNNRKCIVPSNFNKLKLSK